MPEDVYELLSLGMRYWFVLLGVMIVWRSFAWLRKDRRAKHRRLRQLPDAGMIGEMVVLVGSDELPEGTVIAVPREGVLGFLRTCDIVVPVNGIAPQHIDFSFRDGKGLMIRPWRRCTCQVDAMELTHRHRPCAMHHGSRLFIGDAVLRLRIFAGLETSRHAVYVADEPEDLSPQPETIPPQNPPMPDAWHPAPWQQPGPYQSVSVQQPSWQQQPYQHPYPQEPWVNTGYPQMPQQTEWQSEEYPEEYSEEYPIEAPAPDFHHARPRRRGRVRERRPQYEEE